MGPQAGTPSPCPGPASQSGHYAHLVSITIRRIGSGVPGGLLGRSALSDWVEGSGWAKRESVRGCADLRERSGADVPPRRLPAHRPAGRPAPREEPPEVKGTSLREEPTRRAA